MKNNSPFEPKFSLFTINCCYLQTVFLFIKFYHIFATILYNFLPDIFIKVLTAERPRIIGYPPSYSPLGYIGAVGLIHHITINTRQRKLLPSFLVAHLPPIDGDRLMAKSFNCPHHLLI